MPQATEGAAQPTPGLGRRAARGAKVVMLGQLARITLQMVSVVVLARLLTPTDYGLFALALAVVALGEVFRDFGLSTAAIQSPTLTRGEQSNLFWINLGLGGVLAVVCFLGAPLLAAATGHAAAADLARVMALTFVLNGALGQYRADLNRRLRFTALVVSDVGGMAVGVVAGISCAVAGLGYWSLAAQQVAGVGATLVLAVVSAGWLPRPPDRSSDVRRFLRFGIGMVGTQLVGYANNNIDTLTIGLRFSPSQLGVYNRAYQVLMQTLNQFRNPTTTVALPVLSKVAPGTAQADRMLLRGQAALGYTLVAGTAFAAGAADPIISLALGDGWEGAIPLFAVLAVAGAFQTIGFVGYWVFVSRALTGRLFGYSVLSLSIRVACVLAGSAWGVLGVAVGYAVAPALALPVSYYLLGRWTPLPTAQLYAGAARIVVCASLAGLATWAVAAATEDVQVVAQLVVCGVTTLAAYGVLALAVPAVRRDVQGVVRFARDAFGSR